MLIPAFNSNSIKPPITPAIGNCATSRDVQALLLGSYLIRTKMSAQDQALFPGGLSSDCGNCFDGYRSCASDQCLDSNDCKSNGFFGFFREPDVNKNTCQKCIKSKARLLTSSASQHRVQDQQWVHVDNEPVSTQLRSVSISTQILSKTSVTDDFYPDVNL